MPADFSSTALRKPRILISPLDWGLGHATRCIPIIRELSRLECDVWLASDGFQKRLLQEEFPSITILELPGYKIRYSKSNTGFRLRMIAQIPKILDIISYENKWLRTKAPVYEFDAIISDNRYGFHHHNTSNVFITHQLRIKSRMGKLIDGLLNSVNYSYIKKFNQCWVPDEEKETNLAGELSHPRQLPKPAVHYVGILSRFEPVKIPVIKNHVLIVLSGPEPQRTILENLVIKEITQFNGTATIVRGVPGAEKIIPSTNTLKFYNHLPAAELNKEMEQAEFVISRSGYSTIMEIARLNKQSILIPTPGQGEQEYLAKHLAEKNYAYCIDQKKFSLIKALEKANQFNYQLFPAYDDQKLKMVIGNFVKQLEIKINHPGYEAFLG
jgi:UDP-N-acetylglucosamine transferase subunit ALG13